MAKTKDITSCGLRQNLFKTNSQSMKHYFLLFTIIMMNHIQMIIAKFEPYELNGGLITAIAGKDYILIASDTRLSNGYEIQSRSHLSSRLWSVSPDEHSHVLEQSSSSSFDVFHSDGSLRTQSHSKKILNDEERISRKNLISRCDYEENYDPPIFIGSSGCVADCIALQRQFRSEISAYTYWTGGKTNHFASMKNTRINHLTPRQVSILLMNTLYNRRSFPFYSFCIVAGLNSSPQSGQDDHGAVYVYDAIGSNERVAVAAAGTGREMMQPILDRLFAVSNLRQKQVNQNNDMERDGNAIAALEQQKGNILLPPVKTHVSFDCDESIDLLMRGYRSVAEREIAVGDDVVVCLLKRKNGGGHTLELRKFPLKKH